MAQEPTHLPLGLPDSQIIQKIRETSLVSLQEILKFSLISERCKGLVTTAGLKGDSINVSIGRRITITISIRENSSELQFHYYREPDMYWGVGAYGRKKKLTAPLSVIVNEYIPNVSDTTRSNQMKNTSTMQYWLNHLQDIFNYPKIDVIWFYENSFEFDIDDIKEVFGTATQVWISNTGCYAFNQMILQNIIPVEKLSIKPANFQNSEIPGRILMQNFDYLDIDIGIPRMSKNNIYFLRKGSNPQPEYLGIDCTNVYEDDNEVIMEGISHKVIPADHRRKFKPAENKMPQVAEGGIDFFRNDGVKATILFRDLPFPDVEMLVWFDHCVMGSVF
ncbi:hypothetical protein CAEBREN_16428 [Caenorhabditis brenneri]|uniref:F-box domain-containing protein n=1 Tax=Caenorhabditis brenneri TaxID=135651 RepID=G0N0G0_CAEBE|nr:hypothetical protein CAEBREN_16428 [Caenorhabditis brenneri]